MRELSKRLRSGDTVTFAYDALNRPTSETIPEGKSQNVYWGYDLLNRQLYAAYGSPSGTGVSWTYDALGRIVTATNSGRTLSYQYDAASNRTRITWPDTGANALYVAYVYDVLNRVTQIEENGATSGAGLLASYAYDSLGRRSSVARAGGSGAATAYAYDGASRLYTLAQTLAGSASVTYTLGYNAADQIVTKAVSNSAYVANPGPITAGYTANGLNQYTAVTGITASSVAANQPTLTYDPTGALQTETTAGATTTLLYDGTNLVGEYSSSGTILDRYVPGPGVDEPVLWYQGAGTSTRSWLTADNQGSIIGYADQGGNSGATYAYGPYGEPITSSGASAWGGSRYRFTGQIEIPEAQLYFYKARMYDPAMGRFYQTDPVGYESDLNTYAYATNDPTNWSDPSGLDDQNDNDYGTPVSEFLLIGFGGVGAPIAGYANAPPSHTDANGVTTVADLILSLHTNSTATQNTTSPTPIAELVVTANKRTIASCIFSKQGVTNSIGLGLDLAGLGLSFAPGAKLAVAGAGLALSAVAGAYAGVNHQAVPGVFAIVGYHVAAAGPVAGQLEKSALTSTGRQLASYLPVAGQIIAASALAYDAYGAYNDLQQCLAGH